MLLTAITNIAWQQNVRKGNSGEKVTYFCESKALITTPDPSQLNSTKQFCWVASGDVISKKDCCQQSLRVFVRSVNSEYFRISFV
jgi:hypothetical protein